MNTNRTDRRNSRLTLMLVIGVVLTSCANELEPLLIARCAADNECTSAEICEGGECVPKTTLSCAAVSGASAILQPGPPVVDFEAVGPSTTFRTLRLRNIGDCTLTIFEAHFEGGAEDAFECPNCEADRFPVELFPFREIEIEMAFTPDSVGEVATELLLLSDDSEFSEIRIPIRARFDGVPEGRVAPNQIDFSYVPVGRTATARVLVSNHGMGSAPLVVTNVRVTPTGTTALSADAVLTMPVELTPTRIDASDSLAIDVRYHPRDVGDHRGELIIVTNQAEGGTIRVPLLGTSKTPPKINAEPERVGFGEVPVGRTDVVPITIVNEGGSPLIVSHHFGGARLNTDLSVLPAYVPPIRPGEYTELSVFVSPTATGPIEGLLVIETNDPQKPTVTVPLSATGIAVAGVDVVKIELSYENGDSGVLGDDLRDVDMTLENPFGQICNEQEKNPTTWGTFGAPSWFAFGASEEPERIILPNAMQDGTYRVILQYAEDCASVPTELVASLLGITVQGLLAYFSSGAVILDGRQVSDAIDSLCVDHESTQATITVTVSGHVIAERAVSLGSKGDILYALDLVRQGGRFSVR